MATSSVQSLGHYPDRHILLGVAFAVVTAALLIVSGEESLLQAALIWQAPVTRNVLEGVSWLGHWGVGFGLLVVAASAGYLLRRPRLQAAGVCGLFALSLTGLFTELLKHTTCRARPFLPGGGTFLPPLCLEADMHSFPSGHATQVFAIAVILAAAYPRLTLPGYAIGVAVSLSRVALGLHYPSDVLVGAAIGLVGGALCLRSSHHLAGPRQAPSRGQTTLR